MSNGRTYKSEYHLRAHFQGIGASSAGAGGGVGINDPTSLLGLPITAGTPTDGQILKYNAATNAWILGSATVSFANPTAVASDVAVNGVATTAMRSDAAPAVQKATTSVFGLVKPDGTTVTISSGVISVPTATTSVLGLVKPDGTIITDVAGAITVAKASASAFGVVEVDNVTITALAGVISTPGGANPSATGSDAAVNGTATTFMRSDGAPAIQKATTSVFGLVKPDGTTVTVSSGVISTPGGANPTATAGPAAVNGTATTFMRSDGAPAIQKASSSQFGIVEVDNTTITASGGVISGVASATLDTLSSTRGTILYRGASAWLGLAPGTSGYLLKTSGAGADPAWVSGPVGSTGNTYALSCIATQTVKASAFATQGIAIVPLTTFTIDQVIVPINATSGHIYSLNVCVVNVNHVVQSILATTTTTAGSSGKQSIVFNLNAFVSLAAGTRYIISVTDTNAASGVTTMPTYNGGQATVWANLPVDPSDSDNQASYDLAKNTAPVATDTFLVASGVQVFQLRAQV